MPFMGVYCPVVLQKTAKSGNLTAANFSANLNYLKLVQVSQ
jgi:hypothetical protein